MEDDIAMKKGVGFSLAGLPKWFVVLSLLFISFGWLVASVRPPFFGEDEQGHYNYVESLGRNNKWNIYSPYDNSPSLGMRVAYYIWDNAEDKQAAYARLSRSDIVDYNRFASGGIAPTAYQPPFYYWSMAQIYKPLLGQNLLVSFYLLRYVNVLVGYLLVVMTFVLAKELFSDELARMLMTTMVGLLPLYVLTSATVSVQPLVFGLYALMLWAFVKALENKKYYLLAIVTIWLGLLTQQAFLAAPMLLVFVLLMDMWLKRISWKEAVGLIIAFGLGLLVIVPQLWRRHTQMVYTSSNFEVRLRRLTFGSYFPTQLTRFKKELVTGWWDQTRAMIPYYASDTFNRLMGFFAFGAVLGFMLFLKDSYKDIFNDTKKLRWVLMGGFLIAGFLVGHVLYDYVQVIYSAEEYIKARYFYPLLPFFVWVFVVGVRKVTKGNLVWPGAVVLASYVLLFMQFTAVLWLVIRVAKI